MSARPILVDTTRLLNRITFSTPTGIDRVDLAYARHFLGEPSGERHAVASTPFGVRLLPERRLKALFRAVEARWSEGASGDRDPVLARIEHRLTHGAAAGASLAPPSRDSKGRFRYELSEQGRNAASFRWAGTAEAPRDAVYFHTSHSKLDRPQLFNWLDRRPDIRPVFFVHDILPIDFPEYFVPGQDRRHRIRLANVARRAAAIVTSCHDVEGRIAAYLAREGLRRPPITVAPLAVEPIFLSTKAAPVAQRPYFVACSTIEARKNHLMLLQVWRDLATQLGAAAPTLVLVGRRGWESENVIDLLERCPAVREHVIETSDLTTPGLARLLVGARALLMPSFAEGYGIPIVEALSVGTPVIASDIAVFREVAGTRATFIHPLDGLGWRDAVAQAATGPAPARGATPYAPPSWTEHFRIVERLIEGL